MNITIEKLARTNGERVPLSCDFNRTELEIATSIVKSGSFDNSIVDTGDVIHINNKIFLVEADLSVTEIEQDEYAYYKGIDVKERMSQWFEGAFN